MIRWVEVVGVGVEGQIVTSSTFDLDDLAHRDERSRSFIRVWPVIMGRGRGRGRHGRRLDVLGLIPH